MISLHLRGILRDNSKWARQGSESDRGSPSTPTLNAGEGPCNRSAVPCDGAGIVAVIAIAAVSAQYLDIVAEYVDR